jgi:hypothetical protein
MISNIILLNFFNNTLSGTDGGNNGNVVNPNAKNIGI